MKSSKGARGSRTASSSRTRPPAWGMEINEELAAKYSVESRYDTPFDYSWGTTRRRDGSIIRP